VNNHADALSTAARTGCLDHDGLGAYRGAGPTLPNRGTRPPLLLHAESTLTLARRL